ncbi:MAG: hypothetical protein H0T76_27715 [Nannocystis sp.]|nr:hypothetical protein [Nannocystis sp.]MBA3550281.1 hypothetical protein [Nannocystis sp.]
MTADPLRLLKDPATAAVLRRDIGAAARGVPYDVGAGLARFEASLSQGAGGAVAGTSRFGGLIGPLAAGGLLAGGLAAALSWVLAATPAPAQLDGRELAVAPALHSAPVVSPVLSPNVTPNLSPNLSAVGAAPIEPSPGAVAVVEPASRPVKSRRLKGARNEVSAVKVDGPGDYLREARSLNAARGELGQNAARALALAEAGIAQFKDGTFAQEWEGIAVVALLELGDLEGRTRAEAFLQRYPSGTYAPRIRQALDPGQDLP